MCGNENKHEKNELYSIYCQRATVAKPHKTKQTRIHGI